MATVVEILLRLQHVVLVVIACVEDQEGVVLVHLEELGLEHHLEEMGVMVSMV